MAILALSEVPECVELVDVAAKALEDQLADGSFDSLLKSHTVARAVVQMKRGSKRMTAALVRGLRVGEHEIFGHALAASRADVAESDLLDLLGTGVRSTQVGAMIYIFRTARASESIRRAVRVLADDTDSEVRKAAIATLGELRDEAALPLVRKALDDSDWRVREIAAIALGSIGRPDAETISALKRHLSDTNARVQREVVNALAQLESPSSGK